MNMVEKVARSINKEHDAAAFTKEFWEQVARAAIEAMREPSEAMIRDSDAPDMPAGGSVADIWRSMIDAALKE